jgi:hypothetical protein
MLHTIDLQGPALDAFETPREQLLKPHSVGILAPDCAYLVGGIFARSLNMRPVFWLQQYPLAAAKADTHLVM